MLAREGARARGRRKKRSRRTGVEIGLGGEGMQVFARRFNIRSLPSGMQLLKIIKVQALIAAVAECPGHNYLIRNFKRTVD